jgi:Helix-turn-helix domain
MKGAVWQGHPATVRQRILFFRPTRKGGRITQADLLIELLRESREQGEALGLPTIMLAGIAQHSARFNELRHRGFEVINETERDSGGLVLSRYFLVYDPGRDAPR